MKIARIQRPIWSTRKTENLEGVRLLEAEMLSFNSGEEKLSGKTTIVCDNIGAGIGEDVFVTTGSAVRNVVFSENSPFKTVVTAIIDHVHVDEKLIRNSDNFMIKADQ